MSHFKGTCDRCEERGVYVREIELLLFSTQICEICEDEVEEERMLSYLGEL